MELCPLHKRCEFYRQRQPGDGLVLLQARSRALNLGLGCFRGLSQSPLAAGSEFRQLTPNARQSARLDPNQARIKKSSLVLGQGHRLHVIARRFVVIMVIFASQWMSIRSFAATPERILEEAERAYGRSNFKKVIKMLSPLLYPKIRFNQQEQLIQAYKLLGISYVFEKNKNEAEKQFLALLSLRPGYQLDLFVDPEAAVEVFEDVKRRNAEKIKAILEKERAEQERQRREDLRRQEEEKQRKSAAVPKKTRIIEREVVEHPYWINFLPFGMGQFQNGHIAKGYSVMGLELGLGTLSLGISLGLRFAYPDGKVSAESWNLANGLSITQVVSGALFFATVAYGIIDALVYYKPKIITETEVLNKNAFYLIPTIGPNQASGLGMGLTF